MTDQELLRHQYLDALGISSWLPCAQLPGAQASPEWVNDFQYPAPEIPFETDRNAQTGSVNSARAALGQPRAPLSQKSSVESAQQGVSQARAALGLLADSEVAPEAKPVTSSVASTDQKSALASSENEQEVAGSDLSSSEAVDSTPPTFKLAFQRIGSILVVDSLPLQGSSFATNYQQLAHAISSSLGVQGEVVEPFMLPWPMFASKTLDQGRDQATIAVQHKLSKELQTADIKAVLLFGEAAAQMVMERDEALEQLSGVLFTVKYGVKAIASYSLTEAMQLPGIKRQIWQDLQPLLQYLKQGL
ncbi:hypothetical protein [Neptuniibacter sp.]|uniref:hypothetical protein n=1 Tax=Neptuniibacter sp. TaxID=1962643 RepID=UPI00262DA20B|nr:hypothetical protein [Neptuniibacter sp.]MCP4595635.1 hypothetical protein [Neptuniibacter sp.]